MPSILVTGANRGLGLEFTKQYAATGWRVYAACREPTKANHLESLAKSSNGKVSVHHLDIEDFASIENLERELKDVSIDVLLNNAGIYNDHDTSLGNTNYAAWEKALRVNTMAPLKMTEAFIEQVARSEKKIVIAITSRMGSIADNTSGGAYLYRSSKAAVNAVVRSLSFDLKPRGIIAVVIHPGWVQTDMGGKNAPLPVDQSISAMRKLIGRLSESDSGKFFHSDGSELPW